MKQAAKAVFKFCLYLLTASILNSCANVNQESSFEVLEVITKTGQKIIYQVELADTDLQRRRGLMFRKRMPVNQGMLLVYDAPQKVNIWMKNTYIPLDIIYLDRSGYIRKIIRDTKPLSTNTLPSDAEVLAVLELNSGQAAEKNINVGDRILHDVFKF